MQRTSDAMQDASEPSPAAPLKTGTFHSMGTVISLTVPVLDAAGGHPGDDELAAATAVVERIFRDLDADVQPVPAGFRGEPAGPRRTVAAGRVGRNAGALCGGAGVAAPDGRRVHSRAARRRAGPFRARQGPRDPRGRDLAAGAGPPGLVPERRRRRAGERLARAPAAEPWQAGIVDPADRHSPARRLSAGRRTTGTPALATSGSAERGDHIWRSPAQAQPSSSRSPWPPADIVTADVLATAIVAGGTADAGPRHRRLGC